jgi:hypothetical protein
MCFWRYHHEEREGILVPWGKVRRVTDVLVVAARQSIELCALNVAVMNQDERYLFRTNLSFHSLETLRNGDQSPFQTIKSKRFNL